MAGCVSQAFRPAGRMVLWLLAITLPVSLATWLLKMSGALDSLADIAAPLFALVGLPGEAALVFVTAALVNLYSAIAVLETLNLESRAVTIVALMCLIAHNLPVETSIQRRVGSRFGRLLLLRLGMSFLAAALLHALLPAVAESGLPARAAAPLEHSGWWSEGTAWFFSAVRLSATIIILVLLLMILQRVLEEFGLSAWLSRWLRAPLRVLGIPGEAAFLWIVANTLGLAYGAGVMIDHVDRGLLDRRQVDLLNYHIAISHSLLEDTLLFVAIGVPLFWITVPRLLLAALAVWGCRMLTHLRQGMASRRVLYLAG